MLQHVDSLQLHKHKEENMKKEQHWAVVFQDIFHITECLSKTNRSVKPPNPMRPPIAANEGKPNTYYKYPNEKSRQTKHKKF